MDPHTPPPLMSMASSNTASWPRHGHLVISQTVRRKSRSQWSKLQFMNQLNCDKISIQSSAVSAQEGGFLYWPASRVAYKRKSGRLHSPVWSQWSTPPHFSWTQPELHHLDTVCWISKFFSEKCHFPSERALLKWARPFLSIRQTLVLHSKGALFFLSFKSESRT